jgi:hypothetical protein
MVLQRMLKYYKQKHMELNQENIQLKKLVLSYADDLGPKIEEMENDTKRIHREYEKLPSRCPEISHISPPKL